ncbi:3-hydroxy-3-methylglutaryl-coenzyme A reductase [Acrasis kona]|uniref:hydroxymethylglutaryl-CoA reductase (NADPH) n=1 Tax=Acrasis kona TaxID=1008807 RepID=A0AAW2ZQ16_9EUKA
MNTFVDKIKQDESGEWKKRMEPKKGAVVKNEIPRGYGKKVVDERWKIVQSNQKYKETAKTSTFTETFNADIQRFLLDPETESQQDLFKDNIENFIGTVKIPLGIAGPLRMNGMHAQGEFLIPLATTEAALVASISRGISVINQSGGCTAAVILEGINRDPAFSFYSLIHVGEFLSWSSTQFTNYKFVAEKTTRHGRLIDVIYTCEGNDVHMKCVYTSGDASGQNIVTIATEAIINYILENTPVKPKAHYIEGGMSGDKKGNQQVMSYVRGKRVIAEVTIPDSVFETTLHVSPEAVCRATGVGTRGLMLSGAIGASCHFSNAITAMSIALGQDPACAAECHVGLARTERVEGGVYMCVTVPNILVGTVGGGTKLPTQRACLEMMGLFGAGKANALAEIFASVLIAGELSLGAAIVSGDFAKAHKILARDTSEPIDLTKDTPDEAFNKAQAQIVKLSNLPPRDVIMKIYGLYKQSTVGDINISKPGFFSTDLKSKAKYDAWKKYEGLKKEEAMLEYIKTVQNLVAEEQKQK